MKEQLSNAFDLLEKVAAILAIATKAGKEVMSLFDEDGAINLDGVR